MCNLLNYSRNLFSMIWYYYILFFYLVAVNIFGLSKIILFWESWATLAFLWIIFYLDTMKKFAFWYAYFDTIFTRKRPIPNATLVSMYFFLHSGSHLQQSFGLNNVLYLSLVNVLANSNHLSSKKKTGVNLFVQLTNLTALSQTWRTFLSCSKFKNFIS